MAPTKGVKFLIWVYFGLLLLEGVFRKWIFPQLSDVIYIIRDPVVLILYLVAWWAGYFPRRPAIVMLWLLAVTSIALALLNDTPIAVLLFGLRTNYLHLPLVFIMAEVLDREDVIRLGRWWLWLSLPILILMFIQFDADPSAWINVGAGGREMGQLTGALGRIRPSGPFSFITGVVSYFSIAAAFVFYGWMQRSTYPRVVLVLASLVTLVAIPISISRSLIFGVLVVALFAGATALRHLRRIPFLVGPAVAIAVIVLFAADTTYLQPMLVRWDEAAGAEAGGFYGNVVERMLREFTEPFTLAADAPILGHGIGVGTVAGARLLTGERAFLLAESELARIVLELGPFLGFAFIVWRVWLSATLIVRGWRTFLEHGDELPWLLAGAVFFSVLIGQWGPATQLGFAVFGAGLTLAALPKPADDEAADQAAVEEENGAAENSGAAE